MHHYLRTDDELHNDLKFATYKYTKHAIYLQLWKNNDNTINSIPFSLVPQLKYPHKAKCFFVGLYLRLWRNTAPFSSLDGTHCKETTNTVSALENLVYLKWASVHQVKESYWAYNQTFNLFVFLKLRIQIALSVCKCTLFIFGLQIWVVGHQFYDHFIPSE